MTTLPTNRTTANTAAEHVSDHNVLHALNNTDPVPKAGGTMTGGLVTTSVKVTGEAGMTGLTAVRFVGMLSDGGPPVAGDGTFAAGDAVFDTAGQQYVCTAGGTPGSWVAVGSGRVLASAFLTAGFTNPTAATEADVTGMTVTWTHDGRPVNIRLYCPWVSHDQTTKQQIQVRLKRTSNPADSAIQQLTNLPIGAQTAGFTDFWPLTMETGPITAWPSDAAAFVVGTSYSVKLTLVPPASTKARIAAPSGASSASFLSVITC